MCGKRPDNAPLFVNTASNCAAHATTRCPITTVTPALAALDLVDLRHPVLAAGRDWHRAAAAAHYTFRVAGRLLLFPGKRALRAMVIEPPPLRPDGAGLAQAARHPAARQTGGLGHHDRQLADRLVVHAVGYQLGARRLLCACGALDVAPADV